MLGLCISKAIRKVKDLKLSISIIKLKICYQAEDSLMTMGSQGSRSPTTLEAFVSLLLEATSTALLRLLPGHAEKLHWEAGKLLGEEPEGHQKMLCSYCLLFLPLCF